jgi:hypothetical protein
MFNAFTTEQQLYEMLKESQTPGSGLPFQLSDSVTLYNYNPGDCRVVPYAPEDGVYLFFKKTFFETNEPGAQHHDPEFLVFIYTSRGATQNTTSPDAVHAAAKAAVSSIYECLSHTEARRLLQERVEAVVGTPEDYRTPRLRITDVENVMTYPVVEQGQRTVTFWEIKGTFRAQETPPQNPGTPVLGIDDSLVGSRDQDNPPTPEYDE